jgi:hypothetical protein
MHKLVNSFFQDTLGSFLICMQFAISKPKLIQLCKQNGTRVIWLNRLWCLMINIIC